MTARIALLVAAISLALSAWSLHEAASARAQLAARSADPGLQGIGEIMSGVHLHFAKAYSAAGAKNWPLADYEVAEVAENVKRAVQAGHLETNLPDFEAAFGPLEAACKSRDEVKFATAYRSTLSACNQCHQRAGHPYIVVTVPSVPPVSNQQWAP